MLTSNVLMTVVNTDPACYWLSNYVETVLTHVYKLHDFGYRGTPSTEMAGRGATARLLSFKSTDTLPGIITLEKHYGAKNMSGFSVPAAEHSTITIWTRARELDAYRNMLEQYSIGIVSIVADSYDIEQACRTLFGEDLRY